MKLDPGIPLDDMRAAIDRALAYTGGVGREGFMRDLKTQDAVFRCVAQVCEAVEKLEPEFMDAYPEVPWRKIRRICPVLAHEYCELDLEILWNTVRDVFPGIRELIDGILPAE